MPTGNGGTVVERKTSNVELRTADYDYDYENEYDIDYEHEYEHERKERLLPEIPDAPKQTAPPACGIDGAVLRA